MVATLAAPLGNLDDFVLGGRTLERVGVQSDDLAKRLLRLSTSAGDIGLRFDDERRLRDGDIVFADAHRVIAIRVDADDVLVARPTSISQALAIAHALGNRHLPMHVHDETIVVRWDPLLAALFAEHGITAVREQRTVARPFRHAHAPHGHAHDD
jgi:urease accessory protein